MDVLTRAVQRIGEVFKAHCHFYMLLMIIKVTTKCVNSN